MRGRTLCALMSLTLVSTAAALASDNASTPTPVAASVQDDIPREQIIDTAIQRLLDMQEGDTNAEWPYEGVYRVGGRIPIGYRVGGTSIVSLALIEAPGLEEDSHRIDALRRAVDFVTGSISHDLMAHDFRSSYDVRGWGYTYGLTMLLRVRDTAVVDADRTEAVDNAIRFFIDGIKATEIPEFGGWNYARRTGFQAAGPPSPFMTGPTLQALFKAKEAGFEIDPDMVANGLRALERARTAAGSYVYSGAHGERSNEAIPGAVGRMLVSESTLLLGGKGDVLNVRAAIDAFIVHWEWLDKRRAQNGTHVAPYGVAPYYFYFAHFYAAQAIELLPRQDRVEYRRRLHELLMRNRLEEGTWNDRVFNRSANYGTAMAAMAFMMDEIDLPPRWTVDEPASVDGDG